MKKMKSMVLLLAAVFTFTGCGTSQDKVLDGAEESRQEFAENGDAADRSADKSTEAEPGLKEDEASGESPSSDGAVDKEGVSLEEDASKAEMEGGDMTQYEIIQVPKWEELEIPDNDALAFVEDMRLGWCLGNTFDAANCNVANELDYEKAWAGVLTTRQMIQTVAEAGFHTIRIPVSWHNHVDENDQISAAWMDRVQEVVDWAVEEDMYVILNIHHDNEEGYMYPSYAHLERSKEYVRNIWEQIAERFADYDERLIFETLNEPRQTGTDHEWWVDGGSEMGRECIDSVNQLNQAAVDAIRENQKGYNSTRYIMVPGYCASPEFALAEGFALPKDSDGAQNRILVSVHAYTPYNFALAEPDDPNGRDAFSIDGADGTEEIDSFLSRLYDRYIYHRGSEW